MAPLEMTPPLFRIPGTLPCTVSGLRPRVPQCAQQKNLASKAIALKTMLTCGSVICADARAPSLARCFSRGSRKIWLGHARNSPGAGLTADALCFVWGTSCIPQSPPHFRACFLEDHVSAGFNSTKPKGHQLPFCGLTGGEHGGVAGRMQVSSQIDSRDTSLGELGDGFMGGRRSEPGAT